MIKLKAFTFLLIIAFQIKAQNVYIASNLMGKYDLDRLPQNPDNIWDDDSFEITNDKKYALVSLSETTYIRYRGNSKSIQYRIVDLGIKDNDTLNLVFITFHSIDTTFFRIKCDNEKAQTEITINEYNKGEREIDSFPDSIVLKTNTNNLVFYKEIQVGYSVSLGNGTKNDIRCASNKSTPIREVEYTNYKKRE